MSEQSTEVDPAVKAEAEALGWVDRDAWRGPPEAWSSAQEFVDRGHALLPMFRKNNETLLAKFKASQTELAQVTDALKETQASVKALTEFQAAEVKRQVEAKVAALRGQIKEARKDGDEELVDTLGDQLEEAREQLKAPAAAPPPPPPPGPEPWAVAFADENKDWFGKDKKRTAFVIAAAEELKETTPMRGAALLEKAKAEMLAVFEPPESGSRSEGGSRNGTGGPAGGGSGNGTFAGLPSDAKAAAISQERMMVGKGKPFATTVEWHKHFTTVYNATP